MFLSILNQFKDSKNQGVCAAVYLFLIEYVDSISIEALSKELKISKKNIESAALYLSDKGLANYSGSVIQFTNPVVVDDEESAHTSVQVIKNTTEKDILIASCTKILDHLSGLAGVRFSRNSTYDKLIFKHLRAGYSVEDFMRVNQYFAMEWNNPEMSRYIIPSTLYNNNFPARVDQANIFFSKESAEFYKDAGDIVRVFTELRAANSLPTFQFSTQDYKNIVFWVRKFSKENIVGLLIDLFGEWGNKPQYSVHLIPSVVFSDKFQIRMEKYLSKSRGNEHSEIITKLYNYMVKIVEIVKRNSLNREKLIESVQNVTLVEFLNFIDADNQSLNVLMSLSENGLRQKCVDFLRAKGNI